MGISMTLAQYLADQDIEYDVVTHPQTGTSSGSAEASHVPGDRLAKAVVLKGGEGYLLAVLPASHHIRFGDLRKLLGRQVNLAKEEEVGTLFADCEPGAVPAPGAAYGLKVVLDESLVAAPDVYFEGGDHASLIHVTGSSFRRLLAGAQRAQFTDHV